MVKSSRTWAIATVSLRLGVSPGFGGYFGRLLAQFLMAEEIIDSTFFNNYMSNFYELEKHCFGEDEPAMAQEAELDTLSAKESRACNPPLLVVSKP